MKTKLLALSFVVIAALAQGAAVAANTDLQAREDGSTVRDSAYPWSPVGSPFIE